MSDWATKKCDEGYVCAAQGAIGPHEAPCEAGTLSAAGETTCRNAADGLYTKRAAKVEVDCPRGYFCSRMESLSKKDNQNWEQTPPGYIGPLACPVGTFGAAEKLTAKSECTKCTAGRTCDLPGAQEPYGECDAGFYCLEGAWTPRPDGTVDSSETDIGGICTKGHYCPK